jgi:spectinomycin phosphotransferase
MEQTGSSLARSEIVECVRNVYGLDVYHVALIAGRAHADATSYRVDSHEGPYFLKLTPNRPGTPSPVARYLADAGFSQVIAPLRASDGQLATRLGERLVMLFPFVEGQDAFRTPLTEVQWTALGAVVRAVHDVELPRSVSDAMRQEHYSDVWRDKTRGYLTPLSGNTSSDAVVHGLGQLLARNRVAIESLVEHADQLAASIRGMALPMVPCHGDLHAGNVVVTRNALPMIVDWDDPVLAPKERDLMFVGAGIGGAWNRPEESVAFYSGYGPAAVDAEALAYHRCERIVEDVAVFCDQILSTSDGDGVDRALMLRKLGDAFGPNDVVEIAEKTFATL